MAYNASRRRGITTKHKPRAKLVHAPKPTPPPAYEHNGMYPFIQGFLHWSEVKGYSPNTTDKRKVGLLRFIQWCDERGLDHPQQLTKPIIERYQQALYYHRKADGNPLSFRTQNSLLTPVKSWFKWLAQENHILYNPASEVQLLKLPPRLPQVILSVEDVDTLLHTPKTDTIYGIRDRAILETLYSTGIRKMECVNLSTQDIDPNRRTVFIRCGKGGKDRLLPIGERALHWVERYRWEVRDLLQVDPQDKTLFLTDYGEPFIKGRLSSLVRRYLHHAKIDKPGACHLFRHAMATHMLDNGADIRYIQMMLGHSELSTTEVYTQVSIQQLQNVHTATHPATLETLQDLTQETEN